MPISPSDLAYAQSSHCDLCAQDYDAYVRATHSDAGLNLCDAH